MNMSTWTPRAERKANKSGSSGTEKKRGKRRAKLQNQKWCRANYALTQRENAAYAAWCNKVDAAAGQRRPGPAIQGEQQ